MEPNIYAICAGVALSSAFGKSAGGVAAALAIAAAHAIIQYFM